MDARILKLILRNFKGARSLEIEMYGEDVAVYGRNATGKSTLFDAFTWCMFGKDGADRSDFWVKPHDEHGDEIHNLETVVEVVLSIDGTAQTFRHMLAENWVKKNGEAERVYSGNTHSYWVNGVIRSAKQYAEAVSKIVKPEVFRIITNPMAFNAVKWDKRREFLLKLAPVDVDKIMLSRPDYQPIREAVEKYGDIYDAKKVMQDQRKRDNAELDMIPVRISEQTSTRDALGDCDVDAARAEMRRIDDEIMRLDKDMSDGSDVTDNIKAKADALAQAQKQYSAAKMDEYSARADAYAKVTSELVTARAKLRAAKNALGDIESRIDFDDKQMQNAKATLESTREEWYKVDEEEALEYTGSAICPTCGQPIPEDQIEAARQRHIEQYQADKERHLEAISNRGKDLAQQIASMKEAIETNKAEAERLRDAIANVYQPNVDSLTNEAKALEGEPDYGSIERIQQLQAAVDEARRAYDAATADKKPVDESLVARKRGLLARRDALAGVEAKRRQLDICNTRIAELEKRQRELGIQIADTEQFLMLVDRFVAERCSMLEESINSLFPTVRWSLFERQINGGMKDTCICLINGVQFSDANNSARINAGLEIIGVLSKHYGVTVPVFIDNAEAVNRLQPMDAQQIALVVTMDDEKLRVERMIQK